MWQTNNTEKPQYKENLKLPWCTVHIIFTCFPSLLFICYDKPAFLSQSISSICSAGAVALISVCWCVNAAQTKMINYLSYGTENGLRFCQCYHSNFYITQLNSNLIFWKKRKPETRHLFHYSPSLWCSKWSSQIPVFEDQKVCGTEAQNDWPERCLGSKPRSVFLVFQFKKAD